MPNGGKELEFLAMVDELKVPTTTFFAPFNLHLAFIAFCCCYNSFCVQP
jgi:hypothetical protein